MSSTSITRRAWLPAGIALALVLPWTVVALAQQARPPTPAPSAAKATAATGPSSPAKPSSLLPLTATEVLNHVSRSVDWYRDLSGVEQISLPGVDPLARSQLQQEALTAVHLAFEFGKSAEDILGREAQANAQQQKPGAQRASGGGTSAQSAAPTMAVQLEQAAVNLAARAATLKSEMAAVDVRLRSTRGRKARETLAAQRAGIVAALQLVQQIQSNVDQLRHFQESAIAGQGKPPKGLRAQLAAYEKSVPELATGEEPGGGAAAAQSANGTAPSSGHAAPATAASKAPPVNFQPQSAGIVTLIGQWFTLHGYRVQLEAAIKDTTTLESELTDTRSRLLVTVRRLVGGGLTSIAAGSAAQLAEQQQTIQTATGQLRELSGVILPLGEQALTLTDAQTTLEDWSHALAGQESAVAGYLGLRFGFLLGWVAAVLIVSEVWKRAIYRYLPDARRRRPFAVLRRVIIAAAL